MDKIETTNTQNLSGKNFVVAQAIVGDEGTLVFEQGGYDDSFYSPKGDETNFYQLHSLESSESFSPDGIKREISVATDTAGGSFLIVVEYGKAASLTCAGKTSVYSCLSVEETQAIGEKIQSGRANLFSLPVDQKAEYAVELPKAFEGMNGYLVVTSSKHNYSYDFNAYVVPRDQSLPAAKFEVEGVRRMRDGGTTFMTIGKTHNFHAVTPSRGGKIGVDGEEARKLSEAEVNELVSNGRVPGVPKAPTGLITPFTANPLAGGPKS